MGYEFLEVVQKYRDTSYILEPSPFPSLLGPFVGRYGLNCNSTDEEAEEKPKKLASSVFLICRKGIQND